MRKILPIVTISKIRIDITMTMITTMITLRMDAIKKKMEKLANETNEAEMRIAHFEDIKAANELEVATINIIASSSSPTPISSFSKDSLSLSKICKIIYKGPIL